MPTVKVVIEKAKLLEENNLTGEAFSVYHSALGRWPENFGLLIGAGRTACKLGKTENGFEYFRKAITFHPERPQGILSLFAWQAKTDLVSAAETIALGISRFPDHDRIRDREIWVQLLLENEESSRCFDLDAELDNPSHSEQVILTALNKRKNQFSNMEVAGYLERVSNRFPSDTSKIRYANALIDCGQYIKALIVFEQLNGIPNPETKLGKAICKAGLGQIKESGLLLEQYMGAGATEHDVLRACATFLDKANDLSSASNVLTSINAGHPISELDHLLEFSASILPPKRGLLQGDIRDSSFRMSEPGASRAVILAFGGFALKTGALPFSLIDRFFAGHDIAVGSLVDPKACLFWKGVDDLGGSLETTISRLKKRLTSMNVEKLYTLGNSGGGVGAIVYGNELGARRALSFSGPSDLRKTFLDQNGDRRGRVVIHALQKRLEDKQLNLRSWLEDYDHRCPVHAYYCEEEVNDKMHAENIAHIPEVILYPVGKYKQHECIGSALGTGQLLKEFNSILKDIRDV